MYPSEKRSLYRFLSIYLISTFILFSISSYIFYAYEKHHVLDQQKKLLDVQGVKIRHQLRVLHKQFNKKLPIVIDKSYESAFFDIDHNLIFSTYKLFNEINNTNQYYMDNDNLVHVVLMDPYYLGVAYLLVRTPIDKNRIGDLQIMVLLFMLGAGFFFLIIGYFLGRLFISPMRESIEMMNSFIEDTTHELNTPISTILANLELIETLYNCSSAKKEMKRIEIASKTLSRIYDDLTYLKLNHDYNKEIKALNISKLLQERILYFVASIESKSINLIEKIGQGVIVDIDRDDAIRLIDNLISNAIKYNQLNGMLTIELSTKEISIADSGIGIDAKALSSIFERFKRANKSEGGFGIGLHIVHQIVQSYKFKLEIKSKLNQGTKVTIQW